jgi:LDH2 family malate/lactate/ureidoglycolate dehydrogenase
MNLSKPSETSQDEISMPTVNASALHELAAGLLLSVGTSPEAASIVADSLVNANLAGHDSHGVLRLTGYLEGVRQGHVRPDAAPHLLSTSRATAIVDGEYGWGQPAMWIATDAAIERAAEHGLGAVVVHHCYHIGRVAPYVEAVAGKGMIGLAMANAAPAVAPFGGRTRVLGTNPIAWAVPRGEGLPPVCLDVATAGIAEGKLRVARARGVSVPPGNLVNREGRASTEPADFYAGGALLPFGAHKGSGFSLLAQFIGRGLAGMDPSSYSGPRGVNGPFILAIDVSRFVELESFRAEVEAQCAAVSESLPAEGVDAVLLPGEPELATRAIRERDGIPVPESTWAELLTLVRERGVPLPAELERPATRVASAQAVTIRHH